MCTESPLAAGEWRKKLVVALNKLITDFRWLANDIVERISSSWIISHLMLSFSSSFIVPQSDCTWDTRSLLHNYSWTGWLKAFPVWCGCPDCTCTCFYQRPGWRLCTHLPCSLDMDCEKPGRKCTWLILCTSPGSQEGVWFHPVKLISHSRTIGFSVPLIQQQMKWLLCLSGPICLVCIYPVSICWSILSRSRTWFKSYPTQGKSFLLDQGPRAQMFRLILHELPMSCRGSDCKVSLCVTR